ncbi:MAG: pyridoxamine 5'-phosphate oxidase family protein [Acidimicrobiia bacterium]|nr:pyridoxamine 5'-phosphate oxidase family protein [Acidimicrobiia bacterium]
MSTSGRSNLAAVAPQFVAMAHSIVWCTAATVAPNGEPRTRVLHPIWEWDGQTLTGWVATNPLSPKAAHLAHIARMSCTYWATNQDTCTADCDTRWIEDAAGRQAGWDRLENGPEGVGYDPRIIPGWSSADSETFGILELRPTRLRVMPGTVLMTGGDVLTWRADG